MSSSSSIRGILEYEEEGRFGCGGAALPDNSEDGHEFQSEEEISTDDTERGAVAATTGGDCAGAIASSSRKRRLCFVVAALPAAPKLPNEGGCRGV